MLPYYTTVWSITAQRRQSSCWVSAVIPRLSKKDTALSLGFVRTVMFSLAPASCPALAGAFEAGRVSKHYSL